MVDLSAEMALISSSGAREVRVGEALPAESAYEPAGELRGRALLSEWV